MCDKGLSKDTFALNIVLIDIRFKKCGIKLLIIFCQHENLFLISLLHRK